MFTRCLISARINSRHLIRLYSSKSITFVDTISKNLAEQEEILRSDAYFHIFSSPIRQCMLTGSKLPRELMFSIAPFVREEYAKRFRNEELQEISKEFDQISKEFPLKSNRAQRRKAKNDHLKSLLKEARMIKHKIATSINEESRKNFKMLLEQQQKKIVKLRLKPFNAKDKIMLPIRIIRGPNGMFSTVDLNGEIYTRNGLAEWYTLGYDIAMQLTMRTRQNKKGNSSSSESDLSKLIPLIDLQLQQRVAMEMNNLVRHLRNVNLKQERIVQRLRRQDLLNYIERKGDFNSIKFGKIAAIIQENIDEIIGLSSDEQENDSKKAPIYVLEELILDETILSKTIEALKKSVYILDKRIHQLKIKENVQIAKSEEKINNDEDENFHFGSLKNDLPRAFILNLDFRTRDLCVSLFRLLIWRKSIENSKKEEEKEE